MNIDLPNDVSTQTRARLPVHGWEIEYATCLKLMNYPDANGAKGSPARSAGRNELPEGVEQRQTTIQREGRLHEVLDGRCHGRDFKAAFDRRRGPKMQSPAVRSLRHRRLGKSPVSGVKVRGSI